MHAGYARGLPRRAFRCTPFKMHLQVIFNHQIAYHIIDHISYHRYCGPLLSMTPFVAVLWTFPIFLILNFLYGDHTWGHNSMCSLACIPIWIKLGYTSVKFSYIICSCAQCENAPKKNHQYHVNMTMTTRKITWDCLTNLNKWSNVLCSDNTNPPYIDCSKLSTHCTDLLV